MAALELAGRWAASVALKRAGLIKSRIAAFERDFEPAVGVADGAAALKSEAGGTDGARVTTGS